MIVTAKSALPRNVADLKHQVDQVANREQSVVLDRVLRVDGLDERPEFVYHIYIVQVDPEVTRVHQVHEELLAELRITD